MIIEFIILIPVTINFLTIFPNNMKVPVFFGFYWPTRYFFSNQDLGSERKLSWFLWEEGFELFDAIKIL